MRWVYRVTLASGKGCTVPSQDRIFDCLGFFRQRFGADQVESVTERYGGGEPVQSHLLPTSEAEAQAIQDAPSYQERIKQRLPAGYAALFGDDENDRE